ncbi:MAG TPA: cation diffusion facilitator family transporter [Alphaproteobacteria bacterium]|nr:cation diffusion facilitator family transporter [Alphaproteobacteria bacterium]
MSDAATRRESAKLMTGATYASVTVAATLIVVKIGAYLVTDSVALLSTLIDSLLDVAASVINLVAVRHALVPADREHRFGHGKAEALAGLGQSAFIAGSAVFLIFIAGHRLFDVQPVHNGTVGIAVMALSVALTLGLLRYQRYVVRATRSLAIKADALHYLGDLMVNGSVMLALFLGVEFGWYVLDPVFAIVIAVYIVVSAWYIARQSLDQLMDRELPDEARQRIREIVLAHPGVVTLHDLRTRASGPMQFIQLHLEMDPAITLLRAHEIADAVEARLQQAFPEAEVMIHEDPAGLPEPRRSYAR